MLIDLYKEKTYIKDSDIWILNFDSTKGLD